MKDRRTALYPLQVRLIAALLLAHVVLFSASCARSGKESRGPAGAAAAEKAAEPSAELFSIRDRIPIHVVYFDNENEDNTRWLGLAVSDFEKTHPTVKVILNPVYGTETDYANKISLSLKSDASIDVVLFDGALLNAFIGSGYLVGFMADTWDEWISKFPGKTKATVGHNGLDWAMPVSLEVPGLFYNAKLFKKAGIPTPWEPDTWADVEKAARVLAKHAEYPLWIPASSAQPETTTLQTFGTLLSGTWDWMYEDGKWISSSEGMLEVFSFLNRLYHADPVMEALPRSVMLSRHSDETLARKLNAQEIGILLASCRFGPVIARTTSEYRTNILVTPVPRKNGGPTSVTGSWMLGISNMSSNKFISFEFLKSALSPRVQTLSCTLRGDIPVRRDVEASESWRENNWYAGIMSDYLYFSRFRPEGPEYPQVSRLIGIAVESAVMGTKSPEQVVSEFAAGMEKMIPEQNRRRKDLE